MYVEKDTSGKIIIQDITSEEACYMTNCISSYLANRPLDGRTDTERKLIFLMIELEKYAHGSETV